MGWWNEGMRTAGLWSRELEQMRNFISDKAADCTSALYSLIAAFNRDVSFLTDRPTKRQIYNTGMKHLSPSQTPPHTYCTPLPTPITQHTQCRTHTYNRIQIYTSATLTHEDDTSTIRSGQWQKWDHMSNLECASGVGASCLAGELFRLRCLAPFSPLSPALRKPTMALFFSPVCHRYCSIMFPQSSISYQIRRCFTIVMDEVRFGGKKKQSGMFVFKWLVKDFHKLSMLVHESWILLTLFACFFLYWRVQYYTKQPTSLKCIAKKSSNDLTSFMKTKVR